jgi:ZIP family zinc transporter
MNLLIYLLGLATFLSTLIGGALALKFKKSLPYFFAFAAGSIVAVAFLDILPESITTATALGIPLRSIFLTIVGSFFLFGLLEKMFATHDMDEHDHDEHESGHMHAHILGPIGASSLIFHSLLDGAAIGTAFAINATAGIIVALAVIFHDATDGINTVVVMLRNNQSVKKAAGFLFADALAPVAGLMLTSLITLPASWLVYILAFFVGEFLYIGASTLIPETRNYPSRKLLILTALGIIMIAVLTAFI